MEGPAEGSVGGGTEEKWKGEAPVHNTTHPLRAFGTAAESLDRILIVHRGAQASSSRPPNVDWIDLSKDKK